MAYDSVDALQNIVADTVFNYASDRKKAAGRALGTLVELVTFYTLRAWDLRDHITIERRIPEFGNSDILDNVEFSLHPVRRRHNVVLDPLSLPITVTKLRHHLPSLESDGLKSAQILGNDGIKRNACVIVETPAAIVVANIDYFDD